MINEFAAFKFNSQDSTRICLIKTTICFNNYWFGNFGNLRRRKKYFQVWLSKTWIRKLWVKFSINSNSRLNFKTKEYGLGIIWRKVVICYNKYIFLIYILQTSLKSYLTKEKFSSLINNLSPYKCLRTWVTKMSKVTLKNCFARSSSKMPWTTIGNS